MKKIYLIFFLSLLAFSNTIDEQLHFLDNKTLLSKAENILKIESNKYLAQNRHLKKSKFFWTIESKRRVDFKTSTQNSETKIILVEKKLILFKIERNLLTKYIEEIKNTIESSQSFRKTLEKLDLFSFEIRLRIADSSMQYKTINKSIYRKVLINKKKTLIKNEQKLDQILNLNLNNLKKLDLSIEKEEQNLIKVKESDKLAKKKRSQKLKKKALEENYLKYNIDVLLEKLKVFKEEKRWIQSIFFLSNQRFNKAYNDFNKTEERIKKIVLESKLINSLENSDQSLEEVQKIVNKLTSFHLLKIKNLQKLQLISKSLIEESKLLKINIDILNEHILKIKVLITVIKIKDTSTSHSLENIIIEEEKIKKIDINRVNIIQKIDTKLSNIKLDLQKSKIFLKEIKIKLENAKSINKINKDIQSLEKTLKDKTPQELIEIFNTTKEDLKEYLILLEVDRKIIETRQKYIKEKNDEFKSLKDSFSKLSREQTLAEKKNIQNELYNFIGLKLTDDQRKFINISSIDTKNSENLSYEDSVSQKINLIKEQKKKKIKLLNDLKDIKTEIKNYLILLKKSRNLSKKYHFTALKIKKQIKNAKIEKSQISNNIIEALNHDNIDKLNQEITEVINYQEDIDQNIKILKLSNSKEKVLNTFKEIYLLIENESNLIEFIDNLEVNFQKIDNNISGIGLKAKNQVALRQLESEDTFSETILNFIKSDEIENLNELLLNYYLDLSKFSNKEKNLETQNSKLLELIKLRKEESLLIPQINLILEEELQKLKKQKQEMLSTIKIKFMIHNNKKNLNKNIEILFEEYNKINAIQKWINLFQERISKDIINNKIISYTQQINTLNSQIYTVQKHIKYINGKEGQILLLRKDREILAKEILFIILIKLFIILLLATLISWLVNHSFAKRSKKNNNINQKPLFKLLQKTSNILIWSITFIIILDLLNFHVGAFLAGFGIGGFAIAIASQEILSDILGGLTIMLVKPFKVGDVIKIEEEFSCVKSIGIRYTILENDDYDYEHIVPNSVITKSQIINLSSIPNYIIITDIELSINNSSAQVELALELIKDIIDSNSKTTFKWIINNDFDKYSFSLKISYSIIHYSDRYTVKSDVNTTVIESFKDNNIEFASMPISILNNSNSD